MSGVDVPTVYLLFLHLLLSVWRHNLWLVLSAKTLSQTFQDYYVNFETTYPSLGKIDFGGPAVLK